jgi:hypothetical protein
MTEQLIYDLEDAHGHRIMSVAATSAAEANELFHARLDGAVIKAVGRFNVCQHCSREINMLTDYCDVAGIERLHRPDGGTNHVVHPDRNSPRRTCADCADRLKRGLSVGQVAFDFASA